MVSRASSGENVLCDDSEFKHVDVERLSRCLQSFQVLSAVQTHTEIELVFSNRVLDGVALPIELVADRSSYEISAVGVETFLHHEVDMAEIDVTEIDRDLFAVAARPRS